MLLCYFQVSQVSVTWARACPQRLLPSIPGRCRGLMGYGRAECWRCGNGFETHIWENNFLMETFTVEICRVFIELKDIRGILLSSLRNHFFHLSSHRHFHRKASAASGSTQSFSSNGAGVGAKWFLSLTSLEIPLWDHRCVFWNPDFFRVNRSNTFKERLKPRWLEGSASDSDREPEVACVVASGWPTSPEVTTGTQWWEYCCKCWRCAGEERTQIHQHKVGPY